MLKKKLVLKSLCIIFLFSFFMPNFTQNVRAILVLEEPILQDVTRTWPDISLLYDNQYHITQARSGKKSLRSILLLLN